MAFANDYREELLQRTTEAEKAMEKILGDLEVPFFQQRVFLLKNKFKIVDFWIPECNVAVEIDGKRHFTKTGNYYDRMREKDLKMRYQLKIIRFTNTEVLKDAAYVACALDDFLTRHGRKK